jgi:chromosome segregation ATPase
MRNKIEPKKGPVRRIPRAEHETEIARLQLEITDLTARLAESSVRELQLSKLAGDVRLLKETIAGLESQLGRTETELSTTRNRIKELEKAKPRSDQ